jgi:predicted nucleic acid-binding protein
VRAIVADTGPLHYLLLTGYIDLLPRLFGEVVVPEAVAAELRHPRAPSAVSAWAAAPPTWLTVRPDPAEDPTLLPLDPGERAAIALAAEIGAALLLVDDRAGTAAARARGFAAIGTIGILDLAARRGLLDLVAAVSALRATNFHYPPALFDALLAEGRKR